MGEKLCQGKIDYKTGGIFHGLFLAPKIKYVSTMDEYGIIQQHMTFKGFNGSKRFIDRSQNFDMLDGKKISAMLPRLWKKSIWLYASLFFYLKTFDLSLYNFN